MTTPAKSTRRTRLGPPTPTCGSTRCGWRRSATRLAERLATLDPDHAEAYRTTPPSCDASSSALDAEYTTGLAECARREIVVSHAAFGYLAERYGLTQLTVSGLDPRGRADPAATRRAVTAGASGTAPPRYSSRPWPARVATVIARGVGATTAVLDPIEGLAPDSTEDYHSVMRANLAALRAGAGVPMTAPRVAGGRGSVGYGGRPVLREGVADASRAGEVVAVLGANGSGKST